MSGSDLGTSWSPYKGQQMKYFIAPEDEVFGGGAGGGGKSILMMMKYTQQLIIEHQRYKKGEIKHSKAWGIFLRRKTTDLEQMVDESHEYFPDFDSKAKYNANTSTWNFPSCGNAKFQFDHMQHVKDRFRYKSSAFTFCVAKGTLVLMGDGSWRAIESISPGEVIATLEGPRIVKATWSPGLKPCVRAVVRDALGKQVAEQVHPVDHRVLSIFGVRPQLFADSSQGLSRSRPTGESWPSYESLLREHQEMLATSVSSKGGRIDFSVSDGGHQASSRPPVLTCFVPLPSLPLPRLELGEAGGVSYARPETGPLSSPVDCQSSPRLHDEQPHFQKADDEGLSRLLVDAEAHIHVDSPPGVRLSSPRHIQTSKYTWDHPYSKEERAVVGVDLSFGSCEMSPCGAAEVFDLTVDSANHYITKAGVSSNCAFDELTEFEQIQYLYMKSRIRSKDPVLSRMLQIYSGSNPDGPGLLWVRDMFIEGKEPEKVYRTIHKLEDGRVKEMDSVFIPFRLKDNPALYESGQYELQLRGLPTEIQEAILNGNWYYASGAYLARVWDSRYHVCPNHAVPSGAPIWRSMDYGYSKPGSCTWWYLDRDGCLTAFYNLYLTEHTPEMWAARIREVEEEFGIWDDNNNMSPISGPLDLSCWDKAHSGTTISRRMWEKGVRFYKSKKGPGSRLNSSIELISRMRARVKDPLFPNDRTKDKPLIRWMERCGAPIRTLPVLRPDPNNAEDVDSSGDDHCYDEARYMCAAKPLVPEKEQDPDEDEVDNVRDIRGSGRVGVGSWAKTA